ncbi:hypothetical protein [Acinetobacter phage vB_AbaS_TCUP2199]|nr:hypothetical protein [Acinetobacter phage vB_AbaS_TCUP2199]
MQAVAVQPEQIAPETTQNLLAQRIMAEQIREYHRKFIGDHFFDPANTKFFRSSIDHGYFIPETRTVIFMTCEKSPTGNVGYTVRKFAAIERKSGVVDLTPFNELTREKAMIELQNAVNRECQHL